ncbi:MAG: radical SAM protein [Chloroflexota bacterium]|nr:MAG: radical SAM protein [Chloroflexota bacterium]
MSEFVPAYLSLLETGELVERVSEAYQHLSICDVCAWECPIDRRAGQVGVCRTGELAKVSSYGPHLGEEDPLRGWRGSGTIFFTRCNLRCQYCQNHDISQTDRGNEAAPEDIANIMLELQSLGCHNINFVSPSHVVPQILAAVLIAAQAGLRIPLVYNTGGYDSMAMLRLLDDVIDIYMPDMKYSDPDLARKYSKIRNYPSVNKLAVKEMHRQVGDLRVDENGVALRGLLVRHLVLPEGISGTEEIVRFISEEISTNTYLNLMNQYHPAYKSHQYPEIDRRISDQEYKSAVNAALKAGLLRLDQRKSRFWVIN